MAGLITVSCRAFADALSESGKLAGLDVGTKTIGLALCDAGWQFAGPSQTIKRTKFTQDLAQLKDFAAREHIAGLVVGLAAQHGRQRLSPAPSRFAPSRATWSRSACRSCCGTSAGRRRRSSGR